MTSNSYDEMVQKRHQEEISGPSDSLEDAPNASELPRPKRNRILSRKARENRDANSTFEIPFRTFSTGSPNSSPFSSETTSINGPQEVVRKQQQPPQRQQNSTDQNKNTGNRNTKEQWQKDIKSTNLKAKKLEILAKRLNSPEPFPEKLKILRPAFPGKPLAHTRYSDPLTLFSRFFPEEIYATIADNTN